MTIIKPGLVAAALLVLAPAAQAQTAQIGNPMVTERGAAGRQVIELDMAALADPAPKRASNRLASAAPTAAEPVAAVRASTTRKRYPKNVGLYGDAPLIALLGWAH
ncbi:hypothetical protein [Novosphingobium sp.]|uniref:hypothetical protein n=1 Tax=Novosphingobium sp. TaxID=1874826 RepID=UPI0025EF7C46|nr:hypothetical protein [Novosphingobium sp.]